MRKPTVLLIVTGLMAATAAPAVAATQRVVVGDNYFVRDGGVPTVTVAKGTRVKWVWRGESLHNVKVVKGPVKFGSSSQRSGSFAKRVSRAGTYRIVCVVHGPDDQSMKLVVR